MPRKKIVKSPIGEALIKFPAMVAMFRIGVDETNFIILLNIRENDLEKLVIQSRSVTVAEAPMIHLFSC